MTPLGLDRRDMRWEEHLDALSPVEHTKGVFWKREDKFAPLGYGGINGSKLRQCIYMFDRYMRSGSCAAGLVSGASVKSPQLPMGAAMAAHWKVPCALVIGATNPVAAMKHENVATAVAFGARFHFIHVAYNPQLQKAVRELGDGSCSRFYQLAYGITTPEKASDADIEAFHRIGSAQVANTPEDVTTLYVPSGSANSTVSILYGLARFRPRLRHVVLFGIGPNRLGWIHDRLRAIERASGVPIVHLFRRVFTSSPHLAFAQNTDAGCGEASPYLLTHYDLHTTKFAAYQDEMPFAMADIEFHPTYEGKVLTYIHKNRETFADFWSGRAMFWIVGSKPRLASMARWIGEMPLPREVPRWPA